MWLFGELAMWLFVLVFCGVLVCCLCECVRAVLLFLCSVVCWCCDRLCCNVVMLFGLLLLC